MYYESFLNSLQPSNVIPESASFNDMVIFTNRSIQDAYNETAISLTCKEMSVFETVMLHEADEDQASASVKKSVLDYVKEFFANIWKAIKEFFQKLIDKIKGFFDKKQTEAMNRLMKKFNDAVKVYASAPAEAKNDDFGYFMNPAWAKNLLDEYGFVPVKAKDLASEALKGLTQLAKEKKDSSAGEEYIEKNFSKDMIEEKFLPKDESLRKAIKAEITNGDGFTRDSSGNTTGHVQTDIRLMGKDINPRVAGLLEELVRNVKKWLEATKKSYNETKKSIDNMMKQAKQLTNINHRSVRAYCGSCKKINSILTKMIGTITRCYKKIYSDGVKVVKKVIAGAKKWQKEKKSTNESFEYEFNSYDPMDEAFNFYLEEDGEENSSEDDNVEDFNMED